MQKFRTYLLVRIACDTALPQSIGLDIDTGLVAELEAASDKLSFAGAIPLALAAYG